MKTKKFWIILTVIVCSLAIIAGAITATVFAVRAYRQAEGRSRAEQYMSELSEYSPQTEIINVGMHIDVYAFSGECVFDTDIDEVYEKIKYADASASISSGISFNADNPTMNVRLYTQGLLDGSLYLHNGKIYVCPYDDDFDNRAEIITQVIDAQELFGDVDLSQLSFDNWQDIPMELDSEQLFELLGLEDDGQTDMLLSLSEDPEKLFTDARKEEGTLPRYVFDIDVSYFESYFGQLEAEVGEQYLAKFSDRSACMFVTLQQSQLRLTMALSEKVAFGANNQPIVTAFDISLDWDADAPYIPDDVYDFEELSEGLTIGVSDRSDEGLAEVESDDVIVGYQFDLWADEYDFSYRIISDELIAIICENRADIVSTKGRMVCTLEYRYNIVNIRCDGQYMTVVLGEPGSQYDNYYMFKDGLVQCAYNYKCITYSLSDLSVASEVILEADCEEEIKVAALCGDHFVLGGNGWCCFIDILDGSYACNTDFYTLRSQWYYDGVSDRIWLYDYYIGAVIVDLKDYSYTLTQTMPEKDKYTPYMAEAEGYEYVNCFARWQGYELGFAYAEGKSYLVIYDGTAGEVVSAVRIRSNNSNMGYRSFFTDDDKLAWREGDILYVADLNALLLQR